MPDIIDDAQAHEAQFLAQALARAHATPGPAAEIVNGAPAAKAAEVKQDNA